MELREQLQKTLGDAYTIERELGGGGMSRVFLATDQALGRPVVVKMLPGEAGGAVSIERFKREIRLAASLQQANIVPLLSAGDAGGVPYYTMPFVKGESLRSRLVAKGPLAVAECVAILRDVARALAFAHDEGVVHRDIKPENILLSGGTAVVTDFGIAKAVVASSTQPGAPTLTQLGVVIGTPAYMAPEQAVGETVDHRADIYALGVVAYEMLTGSTPFAGRSAQAMLAAHAIEAPEPVVTRRPDVPRVLADLVVQCLAKEQRDRPQSASAVLESLETVLTPSGSTPLVMADTGRSAASERSLAVLPLVNTTRDPENEYFSDGLTEEIINTLGKLPGLRVTARTSAFAMKGTDRDAREIARALNVSSILEGSVRRSGNRVRVALQLIDAPSGHQIWSERYDHELTDLFALQDDIARIVADRLKVELAIDEDHGRDRATNNLEAYDAFLRGRFGASKMTLEGCERAVEHFEHALELDPGYARAYAAMAEALVASVIVGADPKKRFPRARQYANRALALNPALAEAHGIDAYIAFWYELEWERAERLFLRALEFDPGSTSTRYQYAVFLANQGRPEDAAAHARRTIELDPLWANAHQVLGYANYVGGHHREALVACDRALELAPGHMPATWTKGMAQLELEMYDTAVSTFEAQLTGASFDAWWLSQLAITYARMRRPADVRRILERIETINSSTPVSTGMLTFAYAWAGDSDRAIAELDRAVVERSQYVAALPTFCGFDPLRGDPRFERLFDQLKFPRWARAFAGARRARLAAAAVPDEKPSIAVLPFANLSPDPADEYFADGLTDEIITDLSPIHSLRVIARASMMRFKGSGKDPQAVARELQVRYVLDGSVRRAGSSLRLTTRLVDARDGATLWTDKLGGTVEDVFAMQEKVSRTIVEALRLALSPREDEQLRSRPISDLGAYEFYLQARQLMWTFTVPALEKAQHLLEAAQSRIGENARLIAALGGIHLNFIETGQVEPGPHLMAAEGCADRLACLEPDSFALHSIRGWVQWRRGEIREAIVSLSRARELEPNSPDVGIVLCYAYILAGQDDKARELAAATAALDPLTPLFQCMPGFCEVVAARPANAVPYYRRFRDMDGDNPVAWLFLVWSLCAADERQEALRVADELARRFPTTPFGRIGQAFSHALRGDTEAGAAVLRADIRSLSRHSESMGTMLAGVLSLLGDVEGAIDTLENSVRLGLAHYPYLARGARLYAPLRSHPRFQRLLEVVRQRWERGGASADDHRAQSLASEASSRASSNPIVAVLPLTNMSASADDEYFADGMTEDIIAQLSKVASLKVISRTSVMRYKKTDKNVGEVAKELAASHVVEGSVRRAGQRLRIVTQLIDATTDAHLWAETFDRDLTDVFAIQTEVATRVATCLRQQLSPAEERLVSKRPTADLEAYNLYLLGRRHYNLATGDDLEASRARDYYDRAIAQDPTFARAYAAKAELEMWHSTGYYGMRPQEGSAKAVALAEHALSLDPEIGEAHIVLAWRDSWIRYDFASADARCRRAMELNPSHAFARIMYATNLASMGRLDEAIESGKQAVELDPWAFVIRGNAISLYSLARRHEEFEAELRAAEASGALGPASVIFRAQDAIPRGAAAEVLPGVRALALQAPMILNRLLHAWCAAAAGEAPEARNILAELHALEPQQYIWATGLALTYAHLGERDRAFEYLEQAYEDSAGWMPLVNCSPAFDVFRGDPRFETIVKRVGASPA